MNKKKSALFVFFAFLLAIVSANATEYYKVYQPSFTNEVADSIFVTGGVCADSQCASVTSQEINLLDGDKFQLCLEQSSGFTIQELKDCLNDAEINGNIANLGNSGWIVTKEQTGSFGSLTYFFPQGDRNLPIFFESTQYPQVCANNSYCIDDNIYGLNFNQLNEAIAEVGQVNIKNVDNPLKPIQVEIPVEIEETVCSAYQFANENYWYPTQIPQGYSDFDATTKIDLVIQDSQGTTLLEDQVVIPIEAETCAGLSAFSWTPQADLEDEEVTFTITTEVIDKQVITSLIDYASVTETIYPSNLDGTCWTRAYDFTLANKPTFDLTTSIAQIQQGEHLYVGFRGGAWRDESITPMQFEVLLVFDNGEQKITFPLSRDTSNLDVEEYFADLSNSISNLNPGNYEVTLITRPNGPNCISSNEVRQTQQLTILEVPSYSLNIHVVGNSSQALEGVSINVGLNKARDEFQVIPIYDKTQTTDEMGISSFDGLIAGTYTYTASLDGYSTVTNQVIIGSDTQLYINLPQENAAPIVDLPEEVTTYYFEGLDINLKDYIIDFNDAFSSLDIQASVVSGDASTQIINGNLLEIRTSMPNTVEVRVSAQDSSGASSEDTMMIYFEDNSIPVIKQFEASPSNGEQPFTTTFLIEVEDDSENPLTCIIDFDDGTSETFTCSKNDGIISIDHTFTNIGQYNTILTLRDEVQQETAQEQVFVFERTYASPQILTFNSNSQSQELPTDISFDWSTTHPDNLSMECTLRVNGVNNAVDCNEENYVVENYATSGLNVFTLIASDGQREDIRSIQREFYFPTDEVPTATISIDETSGISPLEVTFTTNVEDDNDGLMDLVCTLEFGDGNSIQDSCDELTSVTHTYTSQTQNINYRALLIVTDRSNNERRVTSELITVVPNFGPIIDYFSVQSANGFELPDNLTFIYSAYHPQSLSLFCNLDINGEITPVSCEGPFNINNYTEAGRASFILRVIDGRGLEVTRELNPNFIKVNNPPVIEVFTANQTLGVNSLTTTFSFVISDKDSDELSYKLSFGTNEKLSGSNIYSLQTEGTYSQPGVYNALLEVTDGIDTSVSSIEIVVLDENSTDNQPSIDVFSLTTSDGTFMLPNDIYLTHSVSHPQGVDVTCKLITPLGNLENITCGDVTILEEFNIPGVLEFTLVALDENGISRNKTITQEFFSRENSPDLTLENVAIDIDSVVTPGEFSFALRTNNETLAKRELSIQPSISCDGVTYKYAGEGGFLSTIALSSTQRDETFKFPLKTDTVDFLGAIPIGKVCVFNARVTDSFGTDITIIKNVEFNYPVKETLKPSINGYSVDVMDFISNTINEPFGTGYNKIDFTLHNYEAEAKEISISLISTQLGIGYNEEVYLGPGTSKDVSVPLLFTKDQKGTYPLRVSINDGSEKQIKYSYITIN